MGFPEGRILNLRRGAKGSYPRGILRDNRIGWNVTPDHRTSPDNRPITDRHALGTVGFLLEEASSNNSR